MSKLVLNQNGAGAAKEQQFLLAILENVLLLLHPIMPFVTEEIWQVTGDNRPTIMLQPFPRSESSWIDEATEHSVDYLREVIRAIRNLRTEMNCPPGKEVKVIFDGAAEDLSFLRAQEPYLRSLARVGEAEYSITGARPKGAATAVVGSTNVYLPLGDLINVEEERTRLAKEMQKLQDELARVRKKLANQDFLKKAKEEVVQKEREKADQYEEKIRTLSLSLERIQEFQAERS
jgi:valyl-tRNA synthetase